MAGGAGFKLPVTLHIIRHVTVQGHPPNPPQPGPRPEDGDQRPEDGDSRGLRMGTRR